MRYKFQRFDVSIPLDKIPYDFQSFVDGGSAPKRDNNSTFWFMACIGWSDYQDESVGSNNPALRVYVQAVVQNKNERIVKVRKRRKNCHKIILLLDIFEYKIKI